MMGIPFDAAVAVFATRVDDNIFPNICTHQIYNKTIKYAMNTFCGNSQRQPEPEHTIALCLENIFASWVYLLKCVYFHFNKHVYAYIHFTESLSIWYVFKGTQFKIWIPFRTQSRARERQRLRQRDMRCIDTAHVCFWIARLYRVLYRNLRLTKIDARQVTMVSFITVTVK